MECVKGNRKFIEKKADEEAVSAVIGVILMVAITVAIAATVYVYVSGMIGGTATKTSTLSMNVFSQDDAKQERIWLVSGIEGESILKTSYDAVLLNAQGKADSASNYSFYQDNESGGCIVFNDVNGDGYINAGDTFTIVASTDGYFTFMLTDTSTGATIYKSTSVKY